jgi:hypothetical protein
MKRLTVSLLATLVVVLLSLPSFAANMDRPTSGAVVEAPFLIARTPAVPVWDDSLVKDRGEVTENPTLIEHYGLAPAWEGHQIIAQEERMENPTLRAVSDNVE